MIHNFNLKIGRRPLWHALLILLCSFLDTTLPLLITSVSLSSSKSSDGGPPPTYGRQSLTFDMGQLKRQHVAHGTFFFGPHSHKVDIESNYRPPMNSIQKELLNDEIIDVEKEKECCACYNFRIHNKTHPKQQRLFLGALIADDSSKLAQSDCTSLIAVIAHLLLFICIPSGSAPSSFNGGVRCLSHCLFHRGKHGSRSISSKLEVLCSKATV